MLSNELSRSFWATRSAVLHVLSRPMRDLIVLFNCGKPSFSWCVYVDGRRRLGQLMSGSPSQERRRRKKSSWPQLPRFLSLRHEFVCFVHSLKVVTSHITAGRIKVKNPNQIPGSEIVHGCQLVGRFYRIDFTYLRGLVRDKNTKLLIQQGK